MNRWVDKVAVVTGASSGIGAAIAVDLANDGMKVVALGRRLERLEELKSKVNSTATGEIHSIKCDVSKEEEVIAAFNSIIDQLGGIDVLINNAGVVRTNTSLLAKNNTVPIREVIDTNVMGIVYCTREAFQSMKSRNIDGHVILINSVCGHQVTMIPGVSLNIYPPSKYAVTAMTEIFRQEFQTEGTKIKITSISPGVVRTEIIPDEVLAAADMHLLNAEDIAAAVLYVLGTPPHVQVHELIIRPVGGAL